jgi:hypothetical protein
MPRLLPAHRAAAAAAAAHGPAHPLPPPTRPQERRAALSEGRPVPQDLLGVLLTATDDAGQGMTDEELWEDVHDVMGAGESVRVMVRSS